MPAPEVVTRPARTAAQLVPAAVLAQFYDAFVHTLTPYQYGAMMAILTLVIGTVQVWVEDRTGHGLFRTVGGRHAA